MDEAEVKIINKRFQIYDGVNDTVDKGISFSSVCDIFFFNNDAVKKLNRLDVLETWDMYHGKGIEITRIE